MEKSQYNVMSEVEDSHFWYKGMRLITNSILKSILKSKKINILDAGCGTGGNLRFLNTYGSVQGIDISDYAIKLAKEKGIHNIKKGSIDKIPFADKSFDLVTCFDVLGQKQVNEDRAINEIYRVLKSGGFLLLRVAAYDWLIGNHDIHVQSSRRYTKRRLAKLLLSKKLIPIKKTYANTILFPLIAMKRLVFKPFKIKSLNSDVRPVNNLLNIFLYVPLIIENFIIRFTNLPFGMSVIILAKKND